MADGDHDFALIESLLFEGGFKRLERHVRRLEQSAAELGFVLTSSQLEQVLDAQAARLHSKGRYKVRLILERDGTLWSSSELITGATKPPAVILASQPIDSTWRYARHKTTQRAVFDQHLRAAAAIGIQDVLFLNEHAELAEAATSNVFLDLSGELLTPPVAAGVLPGVYRQQVLDTDSRAREANLTQADLLAADAIFLCNSVRGWRQVSLASGLLSL